MTDPLDTIREDIAELKAWTQLHDQKHGDDADMLGRVLDQLLEHRNNAHGSLSKAKQAGGMTAVVTVVLVTLEVLRQFFL